MGIVYKITCNVTGLCYIGSTKTTLEKRLQGHIYDIKYKRYTVYQVLEHNDYNAEILEDCDNKILLKQGDMILYNKFQRRSNGDVTSGEKYMLVFFINIAE